MPLIRAACSASSRSLRPSRLACGGIPDTRRPPVGTTVGRPGGSPEYGPKIHKPPWHGRCDQRGAMVLAERTAWTVGLVCLLAWGAVHIDGMAGSRHELERFAI